MPLDRVEALQLAIVLLQELETAFSDATTPGVITRSEWLGIAQRVGLRAFQEAVD